MIGKTLGRYRITAKLGEGGMGSVWRAEDPALGRTVALKLLSPALWASDTARQRFLREARAASKLDHPSIATVYDVGETDGLDWIAYQFVDGETVAARTERGPLTLAEALALATDTAQALEHAHERGVLHRDVTAGNVMVTREGRAVLVDFGLALPERGAHLTTTGTALGTAGYMAPEVMRGQPADERSDLYGLGAVLYRMVTGRLPFEGGSPEAVLYRMLNEPVLPPSELSPELPAALERVVMKLLEREPADRYASATEVAEALREVAPEQGPTRVDRARRAIARRWRQAGAALRRVGRRRIGVVALASVALLAAATWFAARQGWLPGVTSKPPTLAVLPFRNETDDPEATRYIADGLAEALATNLAQTERLRVLPWVTTQRIQLDSMPLPKLAKELNARKLLLGTLRSTPQGLTVSLSVIDGADGTQTWSRPFEGTAEQLPSLEARMLFETASALLGKLTAEERGRMQLPSGRNGAAYSLYLEGGSHLRAGDPASLAIAEQFFQRSLELDSTFADAHVGLGAAYNSRGFMGLEGGERNDVLAHFHFQRAYELDPQSPLAMQGYSEILNMQGRYREALAVGMRAMRMHPRTLAHELVAAHIYALILPEVGLRICKEILAEDPSDPAARYWAVIAAAFSGQADEVLSQGAEYIRRFGEDLEAYIWMSLAALKKGDPQKALALARRGYEIEGDDADLRALENLADVEEVVLGGGAARDRWRSLRVRAQERVDRDASQKRMRVLAQQAAAMLGDSANVLRHWRALGTPEPDPDWSTQGNPDYQMRFMIKIGRRDVAQQAADHISRRQLGFEDARQRSLNQIEEVLLAPDDDPIVAAYLSQETARHAALLAEFGAP